MKRLPITSALAGAIALTLFGSTLASADSDSESEFDADPLTLRVDLLRLAEGGIPTDGLAYNSFLTISAPEDNNAQIVHSDPEFPQGVITLFPGIADFVFDADRVEVLSVRYEVDDNNAPSRAFASGTGGSDFNFHSGGRSEESFEGLGAIERIEFDGLESSVSNVVIEFTQPGPDEDSDGDGIQDGNDNCIVVANKDQRDSDGDGFGNVCDADLNNDGIVNFLDLGLFRVAFDSGSDADRLDADFDGDGDVDLMDLEFMRVGFFAPPGPSALV